MSDPPPARGDARPSSERLEVRDSATGSRLLDRELVRPPAAKPDMRVAGIESSVLGRVKDFLPKMAAANDELAAAMTGKPAEAFDMEVLGPTSDAPRIEMDIACGVVDLKDDAALRAAEVAMASGRADVLQRAGSDSSGSSDEEEDEEDDSGAGQGNEKRATNAQQLVKAKLTPAHGEHGVTRGSRSSPDAT
eukprot:CAMPEP_0117668422 /NCGR_PEP_ID=MMETSP0804-20121206/11543_1 /TAXON_ID=1074897 /ORGANISM="Tetraselmis astigmatica, Strain CCMP880" /LENGTH=191 /DNA_ID=CAMNT_0005476317 /DNA_START=228 /DNA_END=804 /DNA_ORIENTATION=-